MMISLVHTCPLSLSLSLSQDIHGSIIWIGACFIGVFVKHSNGQPNIYFKWPDIFRMKVRDKNFGIETPGETVYFKMVSVQ